jgi:hypothetical protein
MALSIFDDKSKKPSDKDLSDALEDRILLWNNIRDFVLKEFPDADDERHYSGKNYGWSCRLKDKKRVIIYLTPYDGYFKASLVFGEKATLDAIDSDLSKDIKEIINSAKVYAEERGFRIDITNEDIIEDIKKLIKIKLKN